MNSAEMKNLQKVVTTTKSGVQNPRHVLKYLISVVPHQAGTEQSAGMVKEGHLGVFSNSSGTIFAVMGSDEA